MKTSIYLIASLLCFGETFCQVPYLWCEGEPYIKGQPFIGDTFAAALSKGLALNEDGRILVIGIPKLHNLMGNYAGTVRVYKWNGSSWVQLGTDILGPAPNSELGQDVDISSDGKRIVAGAPGFSTTGTVKVYEWNGISWVQLGQDILGLNSAGFGSSLAISGNGNRIIVGAPFYTHSYSSFYRRGLVRVYEWDGQDWLQIGRTLYGERRDDHWGYSVDINEDGTTIVIGSDNGETLNKIAVFEWIDTGWVQKGQALYVAGIEKGASVAINDDGNIIVIGIPSKSQRRGAVKVFEFKDGMWQQMGNIITHIPYVFADYGYDVDINGEGNRIIIGAPMFSTNFTNNMVLGLVEVYQWTGEYWEMLGHRFIGEIWGYGLGGTVTISGDGTTYAMGTWFAYNNNHISANGIAKVFDIHPGPLVVNELTSHNSSGLGNSLKMSLDGNYLLVGDPADALLNINPGKVALYKWNGSYWQITAPYIYGDTDRDNMGTSIDMNANSTRIIVGATGKDTGGVDNVGMVKVLELIDSQWIQIGQTLYGAGRYDAFGNVVRIDSDGNTIAIGAPLANQGTLKDVGMVQVFELQDSIWIQKGQTFQGTIEYSNLGRSLAISADGNRIAFGIPYNGYSHNQIGSVRIYDWNDSIWVLTGNIVGHNTDDLFGVSISMTPDGKKIAIGAPKTKLNGTTYGMVVVYEWHNNTWTQLGSPIYGDSPGKPFGSTIFLSPDAQTLVIGTTGRDDNGSQSGTVHIYTWNGTDWENTGIVIHGSKPNHRLGTAISGNSNASRLVISSRKSGGSIYTYFLRNDSLTFHLKECDSFVSPYSGKIITTSGVLYDTILFCNVSMIIKTNVTLGNSMHTSIDTTVCDSFISPSQKVWYISGIYYDTMSTQFGCDSIIQYNLTVNNSEFTITSISACDSFVSTSQKIWYTSGIYYDTLQTITGCPKIIQYNLTIHTTKYIDTFVVACDSFISPNGKIWTAPGIYYDTITSLNSCDSIIQYTLHISNGYPIDTSITSCDSFILFGGNVVYNSGSYMDTIIIDSICQIPVKYEITINNSYKITNNIYACDSFRLPRGNLILVSGIYYDTLVSMHGCDSIIQYNITIYNSVIDSINATACDSFISPSGKIWLQSGSFYDTIHTVNGCDSIILFNLTLYSSKIVNLYETSCDSFISPSGHVWHQSGLYYDTLQTTKGCDSILIYNLSITDSWFKEINITSCDYFVSPTGNVWDSSGIYYENFTTHNGCDSVLKYNIEIISIQPYIDIIGDTLLVLPPSDSYKWFKCLGNDSIYDIISNESDSLFIPQEPGFYAAAVQNKQCWDTTQCYYIDNIAGTHKPINNDIFIIVTSKDYITIIAQTPLNYPIIIKLINTQGQTLYKYENETMYSPVKIPVSYLPPSSYFIQIIPYKRNPTTYKITLHQ